MANNEATLEQKMAELAAVTFGCDLQTANDRQIYEIVMSAVNTIIAEKRYNYIKEITQSGAKQLYYMSMEFLVGRSLKNNLYNLSIEKEVTDILSKYDCNIESLYEMEPDAGLGNGGLGRLASCYMDALTTQNYPVTGFSIRYEFGIFKQVIVDGWQMEFPDNWLEMGGYWLNPRPDEAAEIHFDGKLLEQWTDEGLKVSHTGYYKVLAIPYDLFITGKDSDAVGCLRLWGAKSADGFDISLFSRGEYAKSMEQNAIAESISKVLYPADDHIEGKSLRLKQQYFFVSASLQQIVKNHFKQYGTLDNLPDKAVIHINDTHPSLCVPELMRILMDEYSYKWEKAWDITGRTLAYTNHTVMSEALEKWPMNLFIERLPRIFAIVKEIDRRFCDEICKAHPELQKHLNKMAVLWDNQVRMANLCMICCFKVNGVSKLHSEILKADTFREFNLAYPDKITNVTNGIAHRRWLCQSNPGLMELLSELGCTDIEHHPEQLMKLLDYRNDSIVLARLDSIKSANKARLADYIKKNNSIIVDPGSIFDVQVKRLHEYKRQLLNALHIFYLYRKIKFENYQITPQTFIFGAKASPGYYMAKEIIRFICALANMVNHDPKTRDLLKIVFLSDYRVSLAEIIMPAADISEQISLAGKEASGTGNMKLMINGAVTCGTMDGANVEIFQAVGKDNIYIFGMTAEEADKAAHTGYCPGNIYTNDPQLKELIETIKTGGVDGKNFDSIYNYLINCDPYMNLADFDSYRDTQAAINRDFTDRDKWLKMSLSNMANAHIFSADRSVNDYVRGIWHLNKI